MISGSSIQGLPISPDGRIIYFTRREPGSGEQGHAYASSRRTLPPALKPSSIEPSLLVSASSA